MAGLYRRFRDAGYTTPKFLLPLDGRPVLSHVLDGLAGADALVLIANRRDAAWEPAIRGALGRAADLLWVDDTSGQAETATHGARWAAERGATGPIVFHNVDTVVRRDLRDVAAHLARADGFVDVFRSDSPAYSYVALDGGRPPRVTAFVEKRVISPWATTGLYAFRDAGTYLDAAAQASDRSGGEFYVSDVYRGMLARGAVIVADPALPCDVRVLGTPAEYEAAVAGSAP